jgi:hypothetical protein
MAKQFRLAIPLAVGHRDIIPRQKPIRNPDCKRNCPQAELQHKPIRNPDCKRNCPQAELQHKPIRNPDCKRNCLQAELLLYKAVGPAVC